MKMTGMEYLKENSSLCFHRFRSLSLIASLLILFSMRASAQTDEEPVDPLIDGYAIGVSDEIVLLWADFTSTGGGFFHQKLYDYASKNNPAEPNEIIIKGSDSISGLLPAQQILDAFSEDINGDGFDDVVSCWSGDDENPLKIVIRQVDTLSYAFIDAGIVNVLEGDETTDARTLVRLVPGNFDADAEKEFVLAYVDSESTIQIILYDTDGALMPKRKAVIQDEAIYRGDNNYINFDISTGDFNGDGRDEVLLAGGEMIHLYDEDLKKEIDKEALFLKIYEVKKDEAYTIHPAVREGEIDLLRHLIRDDNLGFQLHGIRTAPVDFQNNGVDEIVAAYQLIQDDSIYYILQSFNANNALDTLHYTPDQELIHSQLSKEQASGGGSMSIAAGDLSGDGQEELVFAAWNRVKVYTADQGFRLNQMAQFGSLNPSLFSNDRNNRTVVITDLDASIAQDEWLKEIIIIDKVQVGEFSEPAVKIDVYEVKSELSGALKITQRASLTDLSLPLENSSPLAVVTGNFEGDGMRLGTPRKYRETGVFQPLIVLNAPPVHFDVLDDQVYDISNCFSGEDCKFIATYTEGTSLTDQISSEINSDWGLEKKLYTENEIAGIKLNAHLTTTYGGKFSKVKNSSKTVTVSVEVQAVHDDMIYATLGDYTIWEYPVYNDGIFQGYMTTVVPELVENRWFPSKSWSGNKYIPNHEPGNILSYPDFSELQEIISDNEPIKNLSTDNQGLGPNTAYTWTLEFEDFNNNSELLSNKVGIELGRDIGIGTEGSTEVSAAPFGIGGSVSIDYKISVGKSLTGDFSLESLSSHTTTVKQNLSLEVKLGSTVGAETGYMVRPFAYWTESGIMVVDYGVNVDEAAQGYTPTWWQDAYGSMADPALILPWRLDPEKGYALVTDIKRYQTKDIVVYPTDPQPGDTILIYAKIHNFSLIPTPNPVKISFYLGDPDGGGEVITSNDGHSIIATETALSPRSYQWVHMEWIMPEKGRLFAVLDPENTMDEIHENNNKGWIALGPDDISTGVAIDAEANRVSTPESGQLFNYPNPFSESTTVVYVLEKDQYARIKVKDLSGRDLFMQDAGYQLAGENHIEFDRSFLKAGMYILHLELESGKVLTHMMVVMK